MFKPLNKSSSEPLYLQIRGQVRTLILSGDLPAGVRLPAERELASLLEVNRTTVSKAYQELFADGLVEGQVGRGTIVSKVLNDEESLACPFPWNEYFADIGRQSQDPLHDIFVAPDQDKFISLAYGTPDPNLHPVDRFIEAIERTLRRHDQASFQLGVIEGFRETLTELAVNWGIKTEPENILGLNGVQQGLDLIARAFIRPGDTVVVEMPTYIGALMAFREAGAEFIEVPLDNEGMRVDILERILRRHQPQLIYTVPTFQNPSGRVMSANRRRALLALAQRYQIPIVEDDPYRGLYYSDTPPPALKSFDQYGHVIYLSTFSKTVFPGLRLGWLIAPRPVVERLTTIKQFADIYSNTLNQWAMIEFIRQGWLDEHLAYVRPIYAQRCQTMLTALHDHVSAGLRWHAPSGGFFVWCRLENNFRAKDLLTEAKEQRLFFVTGEVFHANQGGQETFRLNFSHFGEQAIREGIRRLGIALDNFWS